MTVAMRLLALLGSLLLAASLHAAGDSARRLLIGVNDPLCKRCACSCVGDSAIRAYDGTAAKVAADAGLTLEFKYYEEDSLMREDVLAGRLDGLIAKTWTGAALAREAGRKFDRIADVRMPAGEKDGLAGVFVVPATSKVKTLADLRGRRVVFGPKSAYEKSWSAFSSLEAAGVKLTDVKADEVPSCKTAVVQLMEDRADVAVISSYAVRYGCVGVVAEKGDIREIGATPAIPFISVFVDERVPGETRARLRRTLPALSGENVPKDLFSAGFVAPEAWAPAELKQMPEPRPGAAKLP